MTQPYPSIDRLTAVILAGGAGTRLRPVIGQHQKVVAQINGRPFLEYLLDQLDAAGIGSVVLCTGFDAESVKSAIAQQYGNIRIQFSCEEQPMGTAGALRNALPAMDSDQILVMNGDSFCEIDIKAFYQWHNARKAYASIALAKVENTFRYGSVMIDEYHEVVSFIEKGGSSCPGWISAGIYLLHRSIIEAVSEGDNVSIENEVFPLLIGNRLFGYQSACRFIDIGTPESYRKASAFLNH